VSSPSAPGFVEDDVAGSYQRAASAGTLRADVVGALWWRRHEGLEQLPELLHRRAHDGRDGFRLTSVKMMLDGVAENHTAAMLDPYLDGHGCASENSGLDFIDPAELPRYVTVAEEQMTELTIPFLGATRAAWQYPFGDLVASGAHLAAGSD
jgi:predicted amidohydrolase YtcJ